MKQLPSPGLQFFFFSFLKTFVFVFQDTVSLCSLDYQAGLKFMLSCHQLMGTDRGQPQTQ